MMRRTLSLAALALAALGCRPITEPAPFDLRFSVQQHEGSTARDAASYGTAAGTIVIVGQVVGETACLQLDPQVVQLGADLAVEVMVREAQPGCARAATAYAYTLRIARVPAAIYHLTVSHSFRTTTQSGTSTVLDAPDVEVR